MLAEDLTSESGVPVEDEEEDENKGDFTRHKNKIKAD